MSTPTPDRMAVAREVAGLILAVAGVAGLGVVMFLVDPMVGFTYLSVVAIVVGILLATGRA